jgi:hypothetical protein
MRRRGRQARATKVVGDGRTTGRHAMQRHDPAWNGEREPWRRGAELVARPRRAPLTLQYIGFVAPTLLTTTTAPLGRAPTVRRSHGQGRHPRAAGGGREPPERGVNMPAPCASEVPAPKRVASAAAAGVTLRLAIRGTDIRWITPGYHAPSRFDKPLTAALATPRGSGLLVGLLEYTSPAARSPRGHKPRSLYVVSCEFPTRDRILQLQQRGL